MSTGSTGSLLPKWQMAILLGAPIALGLGYLYYRNQTANQLTGDDGSTDPEKKKFSNSKTKSISLDGDDKLPKEKRADPKPQTELERAIAFKNDGNTRFKSGKFSEAIEFYNKGMHKFNNLLDRSIAVHYSSIRLKRSKRVRNRTQRIYRHFIRTVPLPMNN